MLSNLSKPARSLASARPSSRLFSSYAYRMAEQDKSALDGEHGSVGQKFQPDGEIGKQGEKVGGAFSKDGAVGKQFRDDGAIGGTAQAAAEQAQGEKKPLFDKEGAIGKHFQADGAIGNVGEQVGGPFSKEGAVGKQFTAEGNIGGSVQKNLGDKK